MTYPTVVFPDAELIVVEHLRDRFAGYEDLGYVDGVEVGTRKPSPMPTDHPVIQVRRVGGIRETVVSDLARIDLLVWSDTDKKAADLAQLVRAIVLSMAGDTATEVVYRTDEFVGPTRYADPDSDQPRWLLTVEVATRGTTVTPTGS